jgi:hypothetical protein
MKSIRCALGIHKHYVIERFPAPGCNEVYGVECDRCGDLYVTTAGSRPRPPSDQQRQQWARARQWLEDKCGHSVAAPFMRWR